MARLNPGIPANSIGEIKNIADDNVVQPFQLVSTQLRGRAVRLGSVLNEILEPHDYPLPVAHLVAEMITLTLLLSSMLKYEGLFTLQIKGDGPVGMLVADVTSKGEVRGCATFDKDRVAKYGDDLDLLPLFLGKGYIAFTVEQKGSDRYQGIVELRGKTLVEIVQHYFTQSEQIATEIQMMVAKTKDGWRSGAIMIQDMPGEEKGVKSVVHTRTEDWNRSKILMDTVKPDELLNPHLHSGALLLRLFHEEGVRVYNPLSITKGCRCDSEKIMKVLATMPVEDIEYLKDNGTIKMHCEFCSRDFVLEPSVLDLPK